MGTGDELRDLFVEEAETISGFYTAARARHWVPTLLWTVLSLIISAACIYGMLDAWWVYNENHTIVDVSVRKRIIRNYQRISYLVYQYLYIYVQVLVSYLVYKYWFPTW